ncbi:MAG: hypothetical protein RIQ77_97 [Pseudomonadota bacterium]
MLFYWLFILLLKNYCHGLDGILVRPNLGTILLPERDVNLSPMIWHHSIAVPIFVDLPKLAKPVADCLPANSTFNPTQWRGCIQIKHLDALYRRMFSVAHLDIEKAQQDLRDVMTEKQHTSRNKRGWFNFLGTVAKKVMGVATEEDIKIMGQHFGKLQVMIAAEQKDRIADVTKLHSYEVTTNERLDHLQDHLKDIDSAITDFRSVYDTLRTYADYSQRIAEQTRLNNEMIKDSFNFTFWLAKYDLQLHSLSILLSKFQSIISSVDELVQGRLTVGLLPPDQLRGILRFVNRKVKSKSSNLYVRSDIQFFYSISNMVSCTFDDRYLYLKLMIPLESSSSTFTIYKIDVVPMQTSHGSGVFTLLTNVSDYVGISKDFSSYIELSEFDNAKLQNALNIKNFFPRPIAGNECTVHLWRGDAQDILKFCSHKIVHSPFINNEFVYTLDNIGYLFYTPRHRWTVLCDGALPDSFFHDGLFLYNPKCDCVLRSFLTEYSSDASNAEPFNPKLQPRSKLNESLTNIEFNLYQTEILVDNGLCSHDKEIVKFSSNYLVYAQLYKDAVPFNLTIHDFTTERLDFELPSMAIRNFNLSMDELNDNDKHDLEMKLHDFEPSLSNSDAGWSFMDWTTSDNGDFVSTIGSIISLILSGFAIFLGGFAFYRANTVYKALIVLNCMSDSVKGFSFDHGVNVEDRHYTLLVNSFLIMTTGMACVLLRRHTHYLLIVLLAFVTCCDGASYTIGSTVTPVSTTPFIPYVRMVDVPTWKTVLIVISFVLSLSNSIFNLGEKIIPILFNFDDNVQFRQLASTLLVSFYSNSSVMHVELLTIPCQIGEIRIGCPNIIHRVRFGLRGFYGYVKVDWQGLDLVADGRRVILPTSASVPFYKIGKAKHLSITCHTLRFILIQGNHFRVVSTWTRLARVPSDLTNPISRTIRQADREGSIALVEIDAEDIPDDARGSLDSNDPSIHDSSEANLQDTTTVQVVPGILSPPSLVFS